MSEEHHGFKPETKAIASGRRKNELSLAPVLYPTSVFEIDSAEEAHEMAKAVGAERFYTRYGNPTINAFESAIAELEGAEAARAFASGMGAVSALILGVCSAGDHIVAQRQLYAGTQLFLQSVCPRFGIEVTFVDGTESGAFDTAIQPGRTMLVFAETPANPSLDLVDLAELGAITRSTTVVDSTFATPFGQNPIAYGVDLVLHSATKGIAGHNDATIGVIAGSADLISWLWGFSVLHGANAAPFDAFNAHRGLRTLSARLTQQESTAYKVALFLENHENILGVRYPGLESHPQHLLARRQMNNFGVTLTFDLQGDDVSVRNFLDATRLIRQASSIGGPETLITHPASTTHVGLSPGDLSAAGIGAGTIRLSCGLEHVDDVLDDLDQALAVVST